FSILNLRMNGSGYSYFHELVKMSCKKRATAKKNTFLLFGNAPTLLRLDAVNMMNAYMMSQLHTLHVI
ncbi:MAG: hypothetical protein D3905_09415, partial [Candidatus Electrothrix sp. AS4_5]|nr:hypothetical protein [Candidatus Electrothrix gigas]